MENLKDVSQENYENVVTQVLEKYKKVKSADPVELASLASELHGHWKNISSHLNARTKKAAAPKRKTVTPKKVK